MNSLPRLGQGGLGCFTRGLVGVITAFPVTLIRIRLIPQAGSQPLLYPPPSAFHKTGRNQELLNLLEMHHWGWRGELQSRQAEHGCEPCFLRNTQAQAEKVSEKPHYFSVKASGHGGCCSYGRLMLCLLIRTVPSHALLASHPVQRLQPASMALNFHASYFLCCLAARAVCRGLLGPPRQSQLSSFLCGASFLFPSTSIN